MFTQLQIYNMALSLAGSTQQLKGLTYTGSKPHEAVMCDLFWPMALEATARAHNWKTLTARTQLEAAEEPPISDYDSAFELPEDCLRVLDIGGQAAWVVEGRYLLANAGAVTIRYVRRFEQDEELTDPLFVEALVLRLAAYLSMGLGQIAIKREQLHLWLEQVCLPLGRFVDTTEQSVQTFEATDWLGSRR